MLKPALLASLSLLLLGASLVAGVQSDEEENKLAKQLARRGDLFTDYSFKRKYFKPIDLGPLLLKLDTALFGNVARVEYQSLKFLPRLTFSFIINTSITGNPAIDAVAKPRLSLNMDPILGWYYWDK